MTHTSTLDRIKHLAEEPLKIPATAAGAAAGLVRGAADRLAGAVGAVGSLIGDRSAPAQPVPTDVEPAADTAIDIDPDEPVNVTEALGLDPSPVAKPRKRRTTARPVTGIDAAADASQVDATPADVADAVEGPPER